MKFILIFGPHAVGKMTVGHALEEMTDIKLFHNHMTIELVNPFFNYGTEVGRRLVRLFRKEIFEEVAQSDLKGLIFTYIWAFNIQEDRDYINKMCDIFESKGATVYFVELEADIETRIKRNKHPNRLEHKPSKRDIERSNKALTETMEQLRMNSEEGEIKRENYIKINNSKLSPEEVAKIIKERFKL